jgi:hypothetical protein
MAAAGSGRFWDGSCWNWITYGPSSHFLQSKVPSFFESFKLAPSCPFVAAIVRGVAP